MAAFLEEIFGRIGDLRTKARNDLVVEKMQKITNVSSELHKKIELLEREALRRGSETERFKVICKEIALLTKLGQALKGLQ